MSKIYILTNKQTKTETYYYSEKTVMDEYKKQHKDNPDITYNLVIKWPDYKQSKVLSKTVNLKENVQ